MEKMYATFKTAFIFVGVCFTVYGCAGFAVIWCKKCCCTFGHCAMTLILIVFTFVVAIPVWSVASLDNVVVDEFCVGNYDSMPFNMGKYFKEHKD